MPINRKFLWFIPIIFGIAGFFLADTLMGFKSSWEKIGKPSDNITQIIGIVKGKIVVLTDKEEIYSLDIMNYAAASWTKEENQTWETEPYQREEISTKAPPFQVKQIVTTSIEIAPECIPGFQIGLSQEGELWIWQYQECVGLVPDLRPYCISPILGFVLGSLLIGVGLGLSRILAKRKQSSAQ